MLELKTPVNQLLMVGPAYATKLAKLGIYTVGDLLYHLPSRYEDYTNTTKIQKIAPGDKVSITAKVVSFVNIYSKSSRRIQKAKVADETGEIEVIWYNQPFLKNILLKDLAVSLSGEAKWFGNKLVLESPEYEIIKSGTFTIHTGRLVPIYPETEGLSSKWLRSRINAILTKIFVPIPEIIPSELLIKFNLIGRKEAIHAIHFPKSYQQAELARRRLSFDELLILQIASIQLKKNIQEKTVALKLNVTSFKSQLAKFTDNLPFKLTNAQINALTEILSDLDKKTPMNRLLEGDVGSGKTVVAIIAMYLAKLNGFQSAFLAPTEILANQHYQTIKTLLDPYGIKVALLTGSIKSVKHKFKPADKIDIYVGTHSLLSEKLQITKLALVVIDEQQKFGVEQRATIREKGDNPHVLILTATPIPRTIALTLYADLSLSVIDELPLGRTKIKTWVVPKEKRDAAYVWIKSQILKSNRKEQAFIICPFIEESESMVTVKAATSEFEKLQKEVFSDLRLGLLHGKLKSTNKQKIMSDLNKGKLDILVATPVVEVGIDIKTATIMMIEAADRFGLAQLHQLRGRVGRGNLTSYCLLFTETDNPKTIDRLKILETVFSGPKLAEYDLKLRGAGEIFGTRQHGHFGLKIADITDLVLIDETKLAAKLLTVNDQSLSKVPLLKEEAQKYTIKKISPD